MRERGARAVLVRHGTDVPESEIDDLVEFLRTNGVEHVEYKVAPRPPTNPRSVTNKD